MKARMGWGVVTGTTLALGGLGATVVALGPSSMASNWFGGGDDMVRTRIVDDADGAGNNYFRYFGTWRVTKAGGALGKSVHESKAADASFEMYFTGSKVVLKAFRGPAGGTAEVFMDHQAIGKIDLAAKKASKRSEVVFETAELAEGAHHVRVFVVGGTGKKVNIDVAEVYSAKTPAKSDEPTETSEAEKTHGKQTYRTRGEAAKAARDHGRKALAAAQQTVEAAKADKAAAATRHGDEAEQWKAAADKVLADAQAELAKVQTAVAKLQALVDALSKAQGAGVDKLVNQAVEAIDQAKNANGSVAKSSTDAATGTPKEETPKVDTSNGKAADELNQAGDAASKSGSSSSTPPAAQPGPAQPDPAKPQPSVAEQPAAPAAQPATGDATLEALANAVLDATAKVNRAKASMSAVGIQLEEATSDAERARLQARNSALEVEREEAATALAAARTALAEYNDTKAKLKDLQEKQGQAQGADMAAWDELTKANQAEEAAETALTAAQTSSPVSSAVADAENKLNLANVAVTTARFKREATEKALEKANADLAAFQQSHPNVTG